jgi:hypothetical protein
VEPSDEDNIGQKEPAGDDAEGVGRLRLRQLLPTRSDPAQRGSPTLQLSIGLPPPLHLAVHQGKNALRSELSASKTRLQPIS